MGFTEAVLWWEEWQLRILVLTSSFIQCFLFFACSLRKRQIPAWLIFLIWLAYLSSDAVAIYALATLFNRNKKQEWASRHQSSTSLQVLWAPILLVHLGGQTGITAYNIEDNELWRRHVLTTVSQVTVATYVFCKSWSGDDGILMEGILLFICGIVKCILKPWELKRVSINSLMNSSRPEEGGENNSLRQYVRGATQYFQTSRGGQPSGSSEGNPLQVEELYGLFVDLAPPFSHRLRCLKHLLVLNGEKTHHLIRSCLSVTFDRLYTKEVPWTWSISSFWLPDFFSCSNFLRLIAAASLTLVMLALHNINSKKVYNDIDVKITYILLCCTAVLECFTALIIVFMNIWPDKMRRLRRIHGWFNRRPWPDQAAQYNLLGHLARNRKHRILRKLATLLVYKDYVDQLWCMKPSKSSHDITELIHGYLAKGWKEHHIKDIATYRAFNDNRGQWTLKREACGRNLEWSLGRPFDESVLLWHIATDFCFHTMDASKSASHETSRRCRTMSNYMAYLLFVNPEMLMTGARRSIFKAAYEEIKRLLKEENPPLDDGAPENTRAGDGHIWYEKELALKIRGQVMVTDCSGGLRDARWLAKYLMDLCGEGEEKMWRVIQGVWVEMLCFSAGRCRGYLHAKSLGKGGEYLSYVWLLLLYMGMETLAEKMQRTELQEEARNDAGSTNGTTNATTSGIPAVPATGGHGDGTSEASPGTARGGSADDTTAASPVAATGGGGDGTTAAFDGGEIV